MAVEALFTREPQRATARASQQKSIDSVCRGGGRRPTEHDTRDLYFIRGTGTNMTFGPIQCLVSKITFKDRKPCLMERRDAEPTYIPIK